VQEYPPTQKSVNEAWATTSAVVAWLRLLRVHHKISRTLEERCRDYNLSLAQFDVLAHVGALEGMTQQALANRLLVTKGNVCQLLDRMEQARLITRRQQGRSNCLFLTSKGLEIFADVVPSHEKEISELFEALSFDEQIQLADLLRKLDRSVP
jgi:DNA-binding MarR family transcriptional regulator